MNLYNSPGARRRPSLEPRKISSLSLQRSPSNQSSNDVPGAYDVRTMDHASAAAHRLPQQEGEGEGSGSSRLFNTLAYVFAKQEPNAPTPPPPQHLVDIAAQTLYFATAGGLAQGLVQYLHERRRAGAPTSPSLYTQRKHAFQNVSSAIIRGLTRTGALAFLYFTTVGHLNSTRRPLARSSTHPSTHPVAPRSFVPSFSRSLVLSFARSSPRPSTATSTTQKRTSTPCAAASSPEDSSARWASA